MTTTPHPLHPTDPAWRVCRDCDYAFAAILDACPNPACYPGMGEVNRRRREWAQRRDEWVRAKQASAASSGTFYQLGALVEQFERLHPFE